MFAFCHCSPSGDKATDFDEIVQQQIREVEMKGQENFGYPKPGVQSPTGALIMEQEFFAGSQGEWEEVQAMEFDVIIIGTGFCGYAVMERLLQKNPMTRILVLERGSVFLPEHFQNLPAAFRETLGGNAAETFPWTLSQASAEAPVLNFQHGMYPFFGGRSVLWSAWCPEPTEAEMDGWPKETIKAVRDYFPLAAELLHVQKADEVPAIGGEDLKPVYGALQSYVTKRLDRERQKAVVKGVYRTQAAPLASASDNGLDFMKYSTPGEILKLVKRQAALAKQGKGTPLRIVPRCVVELIEESGGRAVSLRTSKGSLPVRGASLVLANGTLPATTLVQNSFPSIAQKTDVGKRFSSHFISSIVARVPIADMKDDALFQQSESDKGVLQQLEMGAYYVAGIGKDYTQQYHMQTSSIFMQHWEKHEERALRYMPDVVATASPAQLRSSPEHVVFVLACLGELDFRNPDNYFRKNDADRDITTNSILQFTLNKSDEETWLAMDTAAFQVMEKVFSPKGAERVEYWHGSPDDGAWKAERLPMTRIDAGGIRVPAMVHESSTLHIGTDDCAPVDTNYKLRGTENVFITGGALWPQGGSWNPTPTMVALAQHLADNLVELHC